MFIHNDIVAFATNNKKLYFQFCWPEVEKDKQVCGVWLSVSCGSFNAAPGARGMTAWCVRCLYYCYFHQQ